ncbi:DNA repair protein RadC [Vibrio sp. S4M6]|uniref:RadC family protein n=1 Tax=Vibrio sinus TaxID=2946865 RepID=UPI00202A1F5C|nr:DNA repair protein RadC [Vibrio sinus]MCL9780346.1 DNA repair protein RadC [Vibrio sinus]
MSLKRLPKGSLPREKLLNQGAHSLSDAELLAIFLRTGTGAMNVLELSDHLLREFGSLAALLSASEQEFCAHHGLGQAKYVQVLAILEMSKRYLAESMQKGNALTSPEQTKQYLSVLLRKNSRESFHVLFLDNQHRVISDEVLFQGTLDSAAIYPREVVKRSLEQNAAAVIFAHNHPSGIAEPSDADKRITRRLIDALSLVEIRVLDHFVVGDPDVVSFAERGLI